MQIVRAQSQEGFKVVGLLIPNNAATEMIDILETAEAAEQGIKQEPETKA